MKAAELLALLVEFYRDGLALRLRHEAGARHMPQYDFNNTYQYVIAREDTQLSWLRAAIEDQALGGTVPQSIDAPPLPGGKGPDRVTAILRDDADRAQAFVDKWRDRVETIGHARHRLLLRLILGEMIELKRFFELALAGRTDLLGRRGSAGAETGGEVLPTRWVE